MNDTPQPSTSPEPAPKPERDLAVLVLKLSGLTFLVLLALLLAAWGAFAAFTPSPQEVCAHKIELALADAQNTSSPAFQSMIDRLRANCVKDKQRRLKLRGQIAYWQYASCVLEAETFADAEFC